MNDSTELHNYLLSPRLPRTKFMKNYSMILSTFILTVFLTATASANIEFSINVHKIKEFQNSEKGIQKEEYDYKMLVDIGDHYFSYTQDGNIYVFDFKTKRFFQINLSSKKYSDDSLYSNIGFRTYEFQNRLTLGGAFAAAGVKKNPMLPVLNEHLFSLQQKGKTSEVSHSLKEGLYYFSSGDHDLASFSKKGHQVSRKQKDMFIKFFRYAFSGHPVILNQISKDEIIPGSISIYRYNVGKEINQLAIAEVRSTENKLYNLNEYSLGLLNNDSEPFVAFLFNIKLQKFDFERHLKSLLSEANKYYLKGEYFDSMLAYLEYTLSPGLNFPRVFQKHKQKIMADENVGKLLRVLNPKSKIKAELSLKVLKNLETISSSKNHVVNILTANTLVRLGNINEAKKLFQKGLMHSPYFVGAYKDIGGVYYNEYNSVMAWRCWDLARQIAPTNKRLKSINEFELRFTQKYPEFF